MTDISEEEGKALVAVLSLAENHPMWSEWPNHFRKFKDEAFANITTVRAFLKRNEIMTLHEMTQRLAAGQGMKP